MAWFDIGVNLTDRRLPLESTMQHAAEANVLYMAITGCDLEGSESACRIAASAPGRLFSTAGVHPHYAKDVSPDYLQQLQALAAQPQVVAIGECGLDFNRNFSPPDTQLEVFEAQLQLACELQLPVFLHERDAFEPQTQLLAKYRDRLVGGVAHCFTGDKAQMQGYLDLDLYIGITGWLCDPKRGDALRQAVPALPLSRLLLETDAPYLFPKTLKPKQSTNMPGFLPHIAAELSQLTGYSLAELEAHSEANAMALFAIQPELQCR